MKINKWKDWDVLEVIDVLVKAKERTAYIEYRYVYLLLDTLYREDMSFAKEWEKVIGLDWGTHIISFSSIKKFCKAFKFTGKYDKKHIPIALRSVKKTMTKIKKEYNQKTKKRGLDTILRL